MINNQFSSQFADYQLIVRLLYSNQLPRIHITYYNLANIREILQNSSIDLTYDTLLQKLNNGLDIISAEQLYHIMANNRNSLLYIAIRNLPVIYLEPQSTTRTSNAADKGQTFDYSTFSFVIPAAYNITPFIGDFIRIQWNGLIPAQTKDLINRLYIVKTVETDYLLETTNIKMWRVTATINPQFNELFHRDKIIDELQFSELLQNVTSSEANTVCNKTLAIYSGSLISSATETTIDIAAIPRMLYTRSYQYNLYLHEYSIRHNLIADITDYDIIPQLISKFGTDSINDSSSYLQYALQVLDSLTELPIASRSYLKGLFTLLELNEQFVRQYTIDYADLLRNIAIDTLNREETCNITDCYRLQTGDCIKGYELRELTKQNLSRNNCLQIPLYANDSKSTSLKLLLQLINSYTDKAIETILQGDLSSVQIDNTLADWFTRTTDNLYEHILSRERTPDKCNSIPLEALWSTFYANVILSAAIDELFFKLFANELIDRLQATVSDNSLHNKLESLSAKLGELNSTQRLFTISLLLTLSKYYLSVQSLAEAFLNSLLAYLTDRYDSEQKLSSALVGWLSDQLELVQDNKFNAIELSWLLELLQTVSYSTVITVGQLFNDTHLLQLLLTNDTYIQQVIIDRLFSNSSANKQFADRLLAIVVADYILQEISRYRLGTIARALTLDKPGIAKFNTSAIDLLASPLILCISVSYKLPSAADNSSNTIEETTNDNSSAEDTNDNEETTSESSSTTGENEEPVIL